MCKRYLQTFFLCKYYWISLTKTCLSIKHQLESISTGTFITTGIILTVCFTSSKRRSTFAWFHRGTFVYVWKKFKLMRRNYKILGQFLVWHLGGIYFSVWNDSWDLLGSTLKREKPYSKHRIRDTTFLTISFHIFIKIPLQLYI